MLVVLPEGVGPTEADRLTGASLGLEVPVGLATSPVNSGGKRVVHAMAWVPIALGRIYRRRGELFCRGRRDKVKVAWSRGFSAPVSCVHCLRRAGSMARTIGATRAARAKLNHGSADG